jgi:hypothetical protein
MVAPMREIKRMGTNEKPSKESRNIFIDVESSLTPTSKFLIIPLKITDEFLLNLATLKGFNN